MHSHVQPLLSLVGCSPSRPSDLNPLLAPPPSIFYLCRLHSYYGLHVLRRGLWVHQPSHAAPKPLWMPFHALLAAPRSNGHGWAPEGCTNRCNSSPYTFTHGRYFHEVAVHPLLEQQGEWLDAVPATGIRSIRTLNHKWTVIL